MASEIVDDIRGQQDSPPLGVRRAFTRADKIEVGFAVFVIAYSAFAFDIYLSQGGRPPDEYGMGYRGRPPTPLASAVGWLQLVLLGMLVLAPLARRSLPLGAVIMRIAWRVLVTCALVCFCWQVLFVGAWVADRFHYVCTFPVAIMAVPAVEAYRTAHGAYPRSLEDALAPWQRKLAGIGPKCELLAPGPTPVLVFRPWPLDFGNGIHFPITPPDPR